MYHSSEEWAAAAAKRRDFAARLRAADAAVGALIDVEPAAPISAADSARPAAGGALAGLPIAVKNNIAVRGWRLTCGSKMLADYVAPYSATVVARLEAAGAVVAATTNLDEFGMGSSTRQSAIKLTVNPWDARRVAGGSSGGSAAAVAAGFVPLAVGTDTGGSVRQPAAFCGLYGLKPTYGHLSRYGLTAYASSLEVAGLLARSVDLVEAAFAACRGADPMDQTSVDAPADAPAAAAKTVAVLKADSGLHPAVAAAYKSTAAKLAKMGYAVREVELPLLKYAVPSYYTIAAAEASANLARYNGIRYGFHPYHAETPRELIERARSEGFGDEVKLRVMLGTFVLRSGFQEQYYEKAQKVRTALARSFEALFAEHDLLLSPVFPTPAFLIDDPGMDGFAQKLADVYTVSANLAGLPALSFPAALADGLPIGLQLTGPRFAETRLLSLARVLEADFPAPPCPAAPGGRP